MSSGPFDHIVVGAGIEGTSTALYLARKGRRVLLLEQFDLPHSNGSSHGETRVIRTAYAEPFFTELMVECMKLWSELEELAETKLTIKTGFLALGRSPCKDLEDTIKNMQKYDKESLEVGDTFEWRTRFPMFHYGDDYEACFDKTGGVILAAKTMDTLRKLYNKFDGVLQTECKVEVIKPGKLVTLKTSKGIYQAPSVIICAGSWTNKILEPLDIKLPLQPLRVKLCYWKEKEADSHSITNGFPTFLDFNSCDKPAYGLPSPSEHGDVKICYHTGAPTDPDFPLEEDDSQIHTRNIEVLKQFVSSHFPGIIPEPLVTETCIYTNTPDEVFILDHHPKYQNIIFGAGFSGTGFKFGPIVGKILGELSMGNKLNYDLKPFQLSRF